MRDGSGYVAVAVAVTGSERTANLCFLDRGGKVKKVVRTSPLWPVEITVAADGTIWGFGSASRDDNPASEDPVIFHFSASGEVLGTALPRKQFGQEPPFELTKELGVAAITSGGDRVVVYSPHTRQLFELALDRRVLGSYVIPLPEHHPAGATAPKPMFLGGLAVTGKGAIYARLRGSENTGIHELDRRNRRWAPLLSELMEKYRSYSLIGSDGEELVLTPAGRRGSEFPVKRIHLSPRFVP